MAWMIGPCGPSIARATGKSSGGGSPCCMAQRCQRSIAKRGRCIAIMRRASRSRSRSGPFGATAPAATPARPDPGRATLRSLARQVGAPIGEKLSGSGVISCSGLGLRSSASTASRSASMARARSSGLARARTLGFGRDFGVGNARTGSLS